MKRILIFMPIGSWRLILYASLLPFILYLSLINLTFVFKALGMTLTLSVLIALSITIFSLVSNPVHIVVKEYVREVYLPKYTYVNIYFLGFKFRIPIPRVKVSYDRCYLAVNVGGCVIPVLVSLILLYFSFMRNLVLGLILTLTNIFVVAYISNKFSRVIYGVGVVLPGLIPPLVTVVLILLEHIFLGVAMSYLIPIAYASSTLGTLIGADLLNIRKVLNMNPHIVSIGGMGTFDGIYLTGLLTISLTMLIHPQTLLIAV